MHFVACMQVVLDDALHKLAEQAAADKATQRTAADVRRAREAVQAQEAAIKKLEADAERMEVRPPSALVPSGGCYVN